MRFRIRPLGPWTPLFVGVGLLIPPASAQAAVSISITSPTPGPIYDVRSRIVVNYASDDQVHPLNLATLSIRVNSVELAPRFMVTPSFAEYMPTIEDGFVAGRLTIEASISDDAGTPASTTQEYEVFPTFVSLGPSTGQPGDVLTLMIHGLDPTPANGTAAFQSINGPLPRPFLTVDRTTSLATVEVPDGVVSGAVSVTINQKPARETHVFNLVSLPLCGDAHEMLHASDGSTTVIYRDYLAGSQYPPPWLYSRCPRPSVSTSVVAAALHKPDGSVQILKEDKTTGSWRVTIQGLARNKMGTKVALLTMEGWQPGPYALHIYYEGIKTVAYLEGTWSHLNGEADFDADENLYVSYYTNNLNLVRFRKDQLAAGGQQTPEVVGTDLNPNLVWPAYAGLVVGCDGLAYLGISNGSTTPGYNGDHVVRMVDLATGQLVAATSPVEHEGFLYMVGTANTHEQFIYTENPGVYLKRVVSHVEPPPPRLDEPQTVKTWSARGFAGLALEANGDVRVCSGGSCPKIYKITPTTFPDGTTTAFPYCLPLPVIHVLPATTRWRPQRDPGAPIDVRFDGPRDLDVATVRLEVTPPAGFLGTYTPTIGPVTRVSGTEDQYTFQWTGPWTYTANNVVRPMPRGSYSLVVFGKQQGGTTEIRNETPYDKVSFVEVTGVRFEKMTGAPALDHNPAVVPLDGEPPERERSASGWRIFAEALEPVTASRPSPTVFDAVRVVATLDPSVPDAPPTNLLQVFLRAIDVDDPSAGGGDVDDEGKDKDNRADFDRSNQALAGLFRGDPSPTPDAAVGTVLEKNVSTGATEVPATFRVSRRQGDNYRVAASTSRTWVEGVRALQKTDISGKKGLAPGAVEHANAWPLQEGTQVSEMLTVWRTLHLEVDRLVSENPDADQARMDVRGDFTKLKDKSLEDAAGPFMNDPKADVLRLNDWVLHTKVGDWIGADLTLSFHPAHVYDVSWSTKTSIDVRLASSQPNLLNGQQDDDITDRAYSLRDDDIASLNDSADYSLATDLLLKTYVKLEPVQQPDQDSKIPFVIDQDKALDRRHLTLDSSYRLPAQVPPSDVFWSVSLISAFNGEPDSDQDPQNEAAPDKGMNLGFATTGQYFDGVLKAGKLRACIFMETLRDIAAKPPTALPQLAPSAVLNQRATAHELLHTMSLTHGQALMCANVMASPGADGGRLTDNQLASIRTIPRPTLIKSPSSTCK